MNKHELKSIWDGASKDNPIMVDTNEGRQVMDWVAENNRSVTACRTPYMYMGMESFESPIDGEKITNSEVLSAHCKRNDVYQLGDDIKRKRQQEKLERGE